MRDKNHMIISIDGEKTFKNSSSLNDKISEEARTSRYIPQHDKVTHDKSIVNITLNGEKLKKVLLKSEMRQSCSLSPLLFNIAPELLAK
jgi:hypothetical protein